ncbi:Mdga1 [Columba guinea]|nr:Mdga1 [Columba guinea]
MLPGLFWLLFFAGDEGSALKMEMICFLFLSLVPVYSRGQGVYGIDPMAAPESISSQPVKIFPIGGSDLRRGSDKHCTNTCFGDVEFDQALYHQDLLLGQKPRTVLLSCFMDLVLYSQQLAIENLLFFHRLAAQKLLVMGTLEAKSTGLTKARGSDGFLAPAQAQIIHAGQACVVKEDNISERVYTIREGDTLVLQCLVTGHPRPQVRWTKTAGSASDKFQETSVLNETLRIEKIQRLQGGRYYCKAENGVGVPAIKSIRVDVQCIVKEVKGAFYARGENREESDQFRDLDEPVLTVHQTISDVRGSFYQEKTVFLRCTVNSNPPARFIWKRGAETLSHSQDNGVDIYEPLYTQGETKVLKLKNLRPQDYASYTCQVSVRNVCSIPDKSITFQLTNTTAPPALKLSVNETLVVNPGDNITMQCSLTGGDPQPEVVWSHSPGPMPPNSLVQGGNLTIWRIRVEDSGYYNCTAINNVGNPAKKTVNLLVRSMKNATFQITPDVIKESETIQLGQDLKLSCHVDAVPQEKVVYSWYKNGKPARFSDRLLITRNDPELPPVTCSLEIIDLRFSDYGTYLCVATFQGAPIPDLSVEVNISSETVPPTISVPKGQSTITVREGSRAELLCEVRGKPKPPIIWSRVDKETPMPSGMMTMETYDGKLRLESVSREMSGTYKCQTARYNGFNIRPREALVQLNVQ